MTKVNFEKKKLKPINQFRTQGKKLLKGKPLNSIRAQGKKNLGEEAT